MDVQLKAARPVKRDGFWYLIRRVPQTYARYDERTFVRISTGIRIVNDPRGVSARVEVLKLDIQLQRHWASLAAGRDPEAIKKGNRAVATAASFGFDYVELKELQMAPVQAVMERLAVIEKFVQTRFDEVVPALMGEHPAPPVSGLMVSDLADVYGEIYAAANARKSPEQLEKWRVPRETSVKLFVTVLGEDKPVASLTNDDAMALVDHWQKRVLSGEVEIDTANKNIGRVAAMVREVSRYKKLKLSDVFADTRIKGGQKKKRVPFDQKFVQDVLLAEGALDGLNDEARAIFYVVAETGMRPSEVAGLLESTIRLDHAIPHVEVKPIGRDLKNRNSERDVPLVGVALEVMRHFPQGFPHYRSRTATLSTTVNKFLRENGMLTRPGQSFYSLRHTFKDRLRDAKVDKELRDQLMGHAPDTEEYGRGFLLDSKRDAVLSIAFKAPKVRFEEVCARGSGDRPSEPDREGPQSGKKFRYKPVRAYRVSKPAA